MQNSIIEAGKVLDKMGLEDVVRNRIMIRFEASRRLGSVEEAQANFLGYVDALRELHIINMTEALQLMRIYRAILTD